MSAPKAGDHAAHNNHVPFLAAALFLFLSVFSVVVLLFSSEPAPASVSAEVAAARLAAASACAARELAPPARLCEGTANCTCEYLCTPSACVPSPRVRCGVLNTCVRESRVAQHVLLIPFFSFVLAAGAV